MDVQSDPSPWRVYRDEGEKREGEDEYDEGEGCDECNALTHFAQVTVFSFFFLFFLAGLVCMAFVRGGLYCLPGLRTRLKVNRDCALQRWTNQYPLSR
jgi:hypothetical protein